MKHTAITRALFGYLPSGEAVDLYTLSHASGIHARITNYGGIIVSLRVPDAAGVFGDVVLGHDRLDGYLTNQAYLGALIGRYANRIAYARFVLQGVEYPIGANNG